MPPKTQVIFDGRVLHVAPGERLLDACDVVPVEVMPTGCRAGHCGRCALRVVEGARGLSRPDGREREALSSLFLPADARLGCQVIVVTSDRPVVVESLSMPVSSVGK